MRGKVLLDEANGDIWPEDFSLATLKSAVKLSTLLEVVGMGIAQTATVSSHCTFLAVATQEADVNNLFIIHLFEKRYYLLKKLLGPCTALAFHPYQESTLFVATSSCNVYRIDIDDGNVLVMEGHQLPVEGIQIGARSPIVVTHNSDEVLLWSWPSLTLTSRLRLDHRVTVVWAGHVWQRDELIVGFVTGSLLIWFTHRRSTQVAVEAPKGLDFDFTAYTLSSGGEWLVGGGRSSLLVTYSLVNQSVAQVIQLPASCPNVFQMVFLPPVHPKYFQVLAILTTTGTLQIIDFTTSTKLKTLRSQRHNIDSIYVSEDGSILTVTYSNSITKMYSALALYPEEPNNILLRQHHGKEVEFRVVERSEKEEPSEEEEAPKKKEDLQNIKALMDKNIYKWCRILHEFGEYPEKFRCMIWVSMLGLPRNYLVFSSLLEKGTHSSYEELSDVFKLCDVSLLKSLQSTLSCLAHWAPFLTSVEYLPELLFPFVKFFHNNRLLVFEASATFILNWCKLWFEFFPAPGVTILNIIEQIICDSDPTLLTHLMKLKVTAEDYAWPLLTSAFSRVLSNNDWMVLWDHILSNPPSFLPCVAAAFTIKSRRTIFTCSDAKEVKMYYRQESWVLVAAILEKAYALHRKTNVDSYLDNICGTFTPIPKGGLPIFSIGPRDAREHEIEELEKNLQRLNRQMESRRQNSSGPKMPGSKQEKQEDMVYLVGRQELEDQEQKCLDSVLSLRRRHLAQHYPQAS